MAPKSQAARAKLRLREKNRLVKVSDAFEELKRAIPCLTNNQRENISKIQCLRLAIEYIKHLETLLIEPMSFANAFKFAGTVHDIMTTKNRFDTQYECFVQAKKGRRQASTHALCYDQPSFNIPLMPRTPFSSPIKGGQPMSFDTSRTSWFNLVSSDYIFPTFKQSVTTVEEVDMEDEEGEDDDTDDKW